VVVGGGAEVVVGGGGGGGGGAAVVVCTVLGFGVAGFVETGGAGPCWVVTAAVVAGAGVYDVGAV
jgi:hypothetical protein